MMPIRSLLPLIALTVTLGGPIEAEDDHRPNILWINAEDMSPHFGCYGEGTIETPNVDRLALGGTRCANAFVTCPVCSPSRSALITGMYQTTIGAQNHRSGRGELKIERPENVPLVPVLFRDAGYYTANGTIDGRPGKTDYNFEFDPSIFDGADWSGRDAGQPFFAQIQLRGGKLRESANWDRVAAEALGDLTDPDDVELPPYYPRDPLILEDWARYLDAVRYTDLEVGRIIDRLESEGILGNTVVFFFTDHGISHARGKQFLYDEGIKIPLIVRGPGIAAGVVERASIAHIDIAAASLAFAGIPLPTAMQGRPFLNDGAEPRPFVVSARDRCDETVDMIRSIRTDHYKLIVNTYNARPYLQPNAYKDHKAILIALRRLRDLGALDPVQLLHFADRRPRYELYDLDHDPWEIHNVYDDPRHQGVAFGLRNDLDRWVAATNDLGQLPEPEAMYDSDMAVYLRQVPPARAEEIAGNIRLMKRWAAEGK